MTKEATVFRVNYPKTFVTLLECPTFIGGSRVFLITWCQLNGSSSVLTASVNKTKSIYYIKTVLTLCEMEQETKSIIGCGFLSVIL